MRLRFWKNNTPSYTPEFGADSSFANSATSNVTGAFYFPTTSFTFIGSNNTAIKSAFIAKTMALIGNSSLQSDTTGVYTGLASTTAALIQ